MFEKICYEQYQKWFCKQYIKRQGKMPYLEEYFRHQTKKDYVRGEFVQIVLFDILDNDGMNRLINKLYQTKRKKEYNVDVYYLTHFFKKKNYICQNIAGKSTGIIGRIQFNENKWLSELELTYTYVNNSQILIKYAFHFRKVMSTYKQIHDFVVDNILKVKKKYYFHTYADKKIIKKATYREIVELDDIFLGDILQAYICELLYTQYGNRYKFPLEYCLKIKQYNFKTEKRLRNAFLCEVYEKNNEYIIVETFCHNRYEAAHYCRGKVFPNSLLIKYFVEFTTEMYYTAFNEVELNELERHMRKYLNSRKVFINSNDIKWLVNKIRYIKEQEDKLKFTLSSENQIYIKNMLGWKYYIGGKEKADDFINYPKQTLFFKNLYQQNLEYLNAIAAVQNDKVVIMVAVMTLFATILGIFISLLCV